MLGAGIAVLVADAGTDPNPIVFFLTALLTLVVVSHQLFHRFRSVDPIVFIKYGFLTGEVIVLIPAAFMISQTLSSMQPNYWELIIALIGLALSPFLLILPMFLALGDKPPPSEY